MTDQAEGASGEAATSGASGSGGGDKDKKEENGKHKKLLRLLTVFAYLSTVSGTAFMLSLYYLFLWTPKVQLGGKALVQDPPPPGTLALFYPEMAPQLAARVAEEEKTKDPQWAARTQETPAPSDRKRKGKGEVSESQVPATPQLVLPSIKDTVDAFGKRREARSTLMEMTTTQQTPPSLTTTQWGSGEGNRGQVRGAQTSRPQTAPASTPPNLVPQMHRTKNKGGGEQASWHSTPHPHPAEIAVHA